MRFINRFIELLTAALLCLTGTVAFADPPPANHHHWRNTNHPSHYVLYDYASRQWIETVNCRVAYRFNLVSNVLNAIELHDPSRNMNIRLTYEGMFLKPSGQGAFSFYQSGTFDRRVQFQHFDQAGNYTGAITKRHGCAFDEVFAGASAPAFRFALVSTSNAAVEIYDSSRDMWVKLDDTRMYLRTSRGPYGFFKNGRWAN